MSLLLNGVATAGAATAFALNYWNGDTFTRSIQGSLAAGDTIDIEVCALPTGTQFDSVLTFTATTFVGTFTGPWAKVRANKTGAAGAATVRMIG